MRVLAVGHHADLGAMYLELRRAGHEVRMFVDDEASSDVLQGMIARTRSWQDELEWIDGAGRERGLVVFEGIGWGAIQDRLRSDGYRVVGGSAYGDRLEADRAYGQHELRGAGLAIAPSHELTGFDEAMAFVRSNPARYVLKFEGSGFSCVRCHVGVLEDGEDMLAALAGQKARWSYDESPRLLLMRHLSGVEVGVGAFFDGHRFLSPPNLDFEHKRFFPGNLGELTGEMGTLVSFGGAQRLFDETLRRLEVRFREARHVGYVNLNLIVNDEGAWPLELTCRFGIPGFAILRALQADPWDVVLERLARGEGQTTRIATHDGFAVGVVITVPPFPYSDGYARLSKGAPILLRGLDDDDRDHLHYGEVRMDGDVLVTAGQVGYVMVVTGRGTTVADARERAYARARKVIVANVRYRIDIGESYEAFDRRELVRLGWLDV